jgi:hypothetical protein
MGWGDVHHCFAMAILVIIIITSPRTQSGDVLLFYVSFSLLLLLFLLRHPERSRVTYCYSTFLFHYYYYYVTPNAVGWRIANLRFFFTIIIILIILPRIFVRSISRRCLEQTLWNLVGISYAMWSCAGKGWFFQNGCRCHGNCQNAKKLKNTKKIIAGYSLNRNWWNLIGTTSTASGTR